MEIGEEIALANERELRTYMDGASGDGTFSKIHRTLRISQRDREWLEVLKCALARLGARSWIYREGSREVWTLETSWWDPIRPQSLAEKASFVRGYFDAEGGIPRDATARFYVQFTQKDLDDLTKVWLALTDLDIDCGKIHNPSARVDPDYWRFFVRARSRLDFCAVVRSWHPRKRGLIDNRLATARIAE